MIHHVLITGGAGFIGSHLADDLLKHGYRVRALDNLWPQVHGNEVRRPPHLSPNVELVVGDVRDEGTVTQALDGIDAVVHFAALVGVGQSMYQIHDYVDVNTGGTSVLMEALSKRPVKKLLVASSMSIYGEGLFTNATGASAVADSRDLEQLKRGEWEVRDAQGRVLRPTATPETKPAVLESVYALTKYDQERLCLLLGRAYGVPTVALRFFNVYGPRQALSNPYTGVLAIFAARLLNDRPPLVFEDGHQRRDFVSVHDVVRACRLAMERSEADGEALNVGSGQSMSVLEVAAAMSKVLGKNIPPQVTGRYRVGDIRHCFADIRKAERLLGFRPAISFADGIAELGRYLATEAADDRAAEAHAELAARGLSL